MATSKSTSKKSAAKTHTAKAPTKRATTVRSKKAASSWELPSGGTYKTLKRSRNENFFSLRVTDQTIYWAILCFIVLAIGIWVITIDDKVQRLYDQIDAHNASSSAVVVPAKKK